MNPRSASQPLIKKGSEAICLLSNRRILITKITGVLNI